MSILNIYYPNFKFYPWYEIQVGSLIILLYNGEFKNLKIKQKQKVLFEKYLH